MNRRFPVLSLLLGLGTFISCKHPAPAAASPDRENISGKSKIAPTPTGATATDDDPFQRYLEDQKANRQEAALVKFAKDCGIDSGSASARYAQSPRDTWILVQDLLKALDDQETDFYGTLAVWHAPDKILVEQWGMELDTGTYSRQYVCLHERKVVLAETVDWTIPPVATKAERVASPAWGYQQRWKLAQDGNYAHVSNRFVDEQEQTIQEPKLDTETKNELASDWQTHTWSELKLPNTLLR